MSYREEMSRIRQNKLNNKDCYTSSPPYPPHQCEELKKINMYYSQRHTGWILVQKQNRPLKDVVVLHDCKACTYCVFVFEDCTDCALEILTNYRK